LIVYHYIHLVAFQDADTGVCCSKINADDGLAWFDDGGGIDGWNRGQGADKDQEEQHYTNP
jgi:hypothetical protein